MKIRTDFVTNSSSSSFTLLIQFKLNNGKRIQFEGHGAEDGERRDYFDDEAIVTVSPKQLGNAKNIDELVKLLEEGVCDGDSPIFDQSRPRRSDAYCDWEDEYEDEEREMDNCKLVDAYDFIVDIREKIESMDDIKSITVSGSEANYRSYERSYSYDRETGKYTGFQYGSPIEKDGSSGGDLFLDDLNSCDIICENDQ